MVSYVYKYCHLQLCCTLCIQDSQGMSGLALQFHDFSKDSIAVASCVCVLIPTVCFLLEEGIFKHINLFL